MALISLCESLYIDDDKQVYSIIFLVDLHIRIGDRLDLRAAGVLCRIVDIPLPIMKSNTINLERYRRR